LHPVLTAAHIQEPDGGVTVENGVTAETERVSSGRYGKEQGHQGTFRPIEEPCWNPVMLHQE